MLKTISYIIQILHGLFIAAIWLSPFYMTDPRYLIATIALQTAILAQLRYFNDRCILTIAEEYLAGKKLHYHKGKSMAGFNSILAKWIGLEGMLFVNRYTPYIVIIANCYKVYMTL